VKLNRMGVLTALLVVVAGIGLFARTRIPGHDVQVPPFDPLQAGTPQTPTWTYISLLARSKEADTRAAEAIEAAGVDRKGIEIVRRRELRREFADRFLDLARTHPKDPAVIDALGWVVANCPDSPQGAAAVDRLIRDWIESEHLTAVCEQIVAVGLANGASEPLFREILRRNSHPDVRARASLNLARHLRNRYDQASSDPTSSGRADALFGEAEALLEEVIEKNGERRHGRQSMAEAAEAELFELRRLCVGDVAPEIEGEDLEGRPMRLGDYRGQVVVLEFWGHWCSVCRWMYPHERMLVKRMRGRPFALLGVNSDTPDMAGQAAAKEDLGWKSWRDGGQVYGGRIARTWNVQALPTTYILDHRGVIRHKIEPRADGHDPAHQILDDRDQARDKWQLRAEEISAVVDRLVKEAEAARASSRPIPGSAPQIGATR